MEKTAREELIDFICSLSKEQVNKILEHWEEILKELGDGEVTLWSKIINGENVSRETYCS